MDSVSVRVDLMRMADVPETVRNGLRREDVIRSDGYIYFRNGSQQVLRCRAGETGEALIRALREEKTPAESRQADDPWRSILRGDVRDAGRSIRDGVQRCVILFRAQPGQEKNLSPDEWQALAPMEPGDAATEPETGHIALIKQAEGLAEDEIAEFAAAVAETIDTETGIQFQAGIGTATRELSGLKESYRQASDAVALGRRFRMSGRVFVYSRMIPERLMAAIPAEARAQLRRELFSAETEKQMTPEMMETIRVFFRNDLNLSTTARQLFIHRNTLIYRLDKIRKETGFDLRRFGDAAAFQMISRLTEDETE